MRERLRKEAARRSIQSGVWDRVTMQDIVETAIDDALIAALEEPKP